ncbi:hypothetical protein POV27_07495 [Aureisphaera galaxeae]|uniref:DUF6896 domain-containing protein n=1 Tax=Aureisphaera galaxeae TaxID=1538023 RepID=UPI00234FBF10|nr:hypothetical protein [Aureisphaera galaxeae]MDC8003891.1 hypothetical protein [Aureisphaera galaxeae]
MIIEINSPIEIEKIRSLLDKNEKLIFALKEGEFSRDYVISLQNEFSNHVVTEFEWINRILIVPSIPTKMVMENLTGFYECIELFDRTAHSLMNLLAETFDIDLNNSNELHHLKTHRLAKQSGEIGNAWKFRFHGMGCSFTNSVTGQFLDVQTINGKEFGQLDTYYLMKFIQTTDSLKEMGSILNDESNNMQKVIEVLRLNGYLIELPNRNGALIINRYKRSN